MITTRFATISDNDPIMTGRERYPIVGGYPIPEETITTLLESFMGLRTHWNCLEKTALVQEALGGQIAYGSLLVTSGDNKSQFGFYWKPPIEQHSWLLFNDGTIIDFALPGVIEKGLSTSDELGPFLIDREPCILAGVPLSWMKYIIKQNYEPKMMEAHLERDLHD